MIILSILDLTKYRSYATIINATSVTVCWTCPAQKRQFKACLVGIYMLCVAN